jgi:hypothetical protein
MGNQRRGQNNVMNALLLFFSLNSFFLFGNFQCFNFFKKDAKKKKKSKREFMLFISYSIALFCKFTNTLKKGRGGEGGRRKDMLFKCS